jgi:hypothetical protein
MTCMLTEIYPKDVLIAKIQAIDLKLEKSLQSSKLDSMQASQSFSIMPSELTKQRNYYLRIYQQCYGELKPTYLNARACN